MVKFLYQYLIKKTEIWDDYTHIRPYTKKSLLTLLADGGFAVEKNWYYSSVSGMGLLMRLLRIRNKKILKVFGRIGFYRKSINVIARKKSDI